MLDEEGFDGWAAEYDEAVDRSRAAGTYPFCGYDAVHDRVFSLIKSARSVLDLGIGTARLTKRVYDLGADVTGVDFSQNMLDAARKKLPRARLVRADLTLGLPDAATDRSYDAIVALYSIHHLTDAQKAAVINAGLRLLRRGGAFIIGDVAFCDEAARQECRRAAGEAFDDEEYYCVAESLAPLVDGKVRFERLSFCAGVLVITPNA